MKNKVTLRTDLSTISICYTILELSLNDNHFSISPFFNPSTHSIRLPIFTQLSDVIVNTILILPLLVFDRSFKIKGNLITLQ